MVLYVLGGMGVGSNARKREKCQAGQCLMGIGMRLGTVGKNLERKWKGLEEL